MTKDAIISSVALPEPVGHNYTEGTSFFVTLKNGAKLFTEAQLRDYGDRRAAAMVREPLTDEQIMAIGKELGLKCRLGGNPNIDFDYARAIEAAHGITGETK